MQAWNSTQPPGTDGVITILDNATYVEDLVGANKVVVPPGSRLLIVAADWATLRLSASGTSRNLDPSGLRPHLLGNIEVNGLPPKNSQSPGEFFIDGLLVEGKLTVLGGVTATPGGHLGTLGLSHSTITPGGGITVAAGDADSSNSALTVNLYRSICGPVSLNSSVPALNSVDSIITSGPASAGDKPAIAAPAPPWIYRRLRCLGRWLRVLLMQATVFLQDLLPRNAGRADAFASAMCLPDRRRRNATTANRIWRSPGLQNLKPGPPSRHV